MHSLVLFRPSFSSLTNTIAQGPPALQGLMLGYDDHVYKPKTKKFFILDILSFSTASFKGDYKTLPFEY